MANNIICVDVILCVSEVVVITFTIAPSSSMRFALQSSLFDVQAEKIRPNRKAESRAIARFTRNTQDTAHLPAQPFANAIILDQPCMFDVRILIL